MRIDFTSHALVKLSVIGVTKEIIEKGLSSLNEIFRDSERSLFVGTSKFRDGILVLVYRSDRAVPREDDKVTIVTIYYTSKVDRLVESKVRRRVWVRLAKV
ncbi:MAG: hypothetical protein HYY67_04625 [Thaumarchaeota archaeon]|nr:hypothetical protein [Nitrososphaerota archaeon]